VLALLLSASAPAWAGLTAKRVAVDPSRSTPLRTDADPFEAVFVVSSEQTYRSSVQSFARNARVQRDRSGAMLVVSELRVHQLADLAERVHDDELRCGGYFAFPTRDEALAFIRDDRSLDARKRLPVTDYRIDNGATVAPWLPQVQEANIRGTISHLSTAYPSRYYASTYGRSAAQWIRDTWLALGNGRSDVSAELFTGCTNCSTQPSVILTVQGAELPNEIVVVGAHLDSISNSGTGDAMSAPGADDDASGIATVTEVIRIALANGWKPKRTVKFMGYAAEEVGLRGSNAIAQSFRAQGKNVVGVLQLDMTNYRGGEAVDMRVITDFGNAALSAHMAAMFDAYLAPLGHTRGTYTCGYGCSDHASWTSAGFPSAMMFEASLFPNIHKTSDTLSALGNNALSSVAFGKLGLAFVGEMAKTSAIGGNVLPNANFRFSPKAYSVRFTDLSSDADGSIATRRWDFGDGTVSDEIDPAKTFATRGRYSVSLTVTDNAGGVRTVTAPVSVPSGLQEGPPNKRQAPRER
jgi:bacterial leucyl aminopeptidase